MKSTQFVIQLLSVSKKYATTDVVTVALDEIDLQVKAGEFIAITGPSGSGKSTLMNIIGLLDTPSHGKYILRGENTTGLKPDKLAYIRNREIGFVFQSFNLLQRASALENVILPAIYAGVRKNEREERGKLLLTQLGLENRLFNRPNQLSGGQQQRVAIARALMNNPALILADEPTGNLDTKSGADVMQVLRDLNKEGKTIVLITHEPDIAKQAQRIIHIRDGKIVN